MARGERPDVLQRRVGGAGIGELGEDDDERAAASAAKQGAEGPAGVRIVEVVARVAQEIGGAREMARPRPGSCAFTSCA